MAIMYFSAALLTPGLPAASLSVLALSHCEKVGSRLAGAAAGCSPGAALAGWEEAWLPITPLFKLCYPRSIEVMGPVGK